MGQFPALQRRRQNARREKNCIKKVLKVLIYCKDETFHLHEQKTDYKSMNNTVALTEEP